MSFALFVTRDVLIILENYARLLEAISGEH